MGFWQHLADSYDKNADALRKTYPLSTTTISSKSNIIAVIIIDGDGNFKDFKKIEKANYKKNIKAETLPIPASEECLKRTSTSIVPYPVFDQYGYLKGLPDKSSKYIKKLCDHCAHVDRHIKKLKKTKKSTKLIEKWRSYQSRAEKSKPGKELTRCAMKYVAYLEQLKDFSESKFSTDQVQAIYKYVSKETIASDLKDMKLKDQINIVFEVEIPRCQSIKVWENDDFFYGWHQYYLCQKNKCDKRLDYIKGEFQPSATFHPKKIFSNAANAKLISSNDKENYTFRGKFRDPFEAVSIGYESSQKAHQFLRYLINDRGYYCGEQGIFSYTIDSTKKELPPPIEDGSLYAFLQEAKIQTESDAQITLGAETGVDFADALSKALSGFGYGKALKKHAKTAVIALESATDGRLAITFYRELDRADYLKKIADWHEGCKWNLEFWDKENEKYVPYIGAPSVDKIIEAVHGKPRSRKDKSYIKMKKGARERLLRCIFDGAFLPADYVVAAVWRASNPLAITKSGKFDRNGFEQILSTVCALVRKDYQQRNREDYKLSIELDNKDRDYLYGRLLGAADKLEEYVLFREKKNRIVTAAIRYMQAFAQHPFRTWQTIHSSLNPYMQTMKGGFEFQEIEAIKNKFISVADYEKDAPLNGSYLIGYYHERAYIDSLAKAASKKKQSTVNNEQEGINDGQ